jgi:hypothetical protein
MNRWLLAEIVAWCVVLATVATIAIVDLKGREDTPVRILGEKGGITGKAEISRPPVRIKRGNI